MATPFAAIFERVPKIPQFVRKVSGFVRDLCSLARVAFEMRPYLANLWCTATLSVSGGRRHRLRNFGLGLRIQPSPSAAGGWRFYGQVVKVMRGFAHHCPEIIRSVGTRPKISGHVPK
jgi:hypothetical protein